MATDTIQIGGFAEDAFGHHVVGGRLLESSVQTVGGKKVIKYHVGLGRGEWDALEQLTYDGVVLTDYTFHPGIADPPQDSRFPNSLRHGRMARYTATLP